MIEDASGNLLAAGVDALVNAVNTVGVMAKVWPARSRSASPTTSRRIARPARRAA
jgi:hypothetical protein